MPNPYFSYQSGYPFVQPQFQQQSFQAQPQQQMPMMQMPQSQPGSSINWVQGDIGARAFYVQPGTSTLLMDSEAQNFYIKSADVSGMPTMKKYAYSEVVEEPLRLESHDKSEIDTAFHATREEVKKLQEEMNELKDKLAQMEVENRNLKEQSKQNQNGGRKNAESKSSKCFSSERHKYS